MKTVYWVTGAENSGNRVLVQSLCSAGCYGNSPRGEMHEYLLDDTLEFEGLPDRLAYMRSVPHGGRVPKPKLIATRMQRAGYTIKPILVIRKTEFAIEGQVLTYGRTREQAQQYVALAVTIMYDFALWLGELLTVVSYELFVEIPEVRRDLFAQLGLPPPTFEPFNANDQEKYQHLVGPPLTF